MKRRSGIVLCLLLLMNLYCNAQEADSILLEEYWNMSLEVGQHTNFDCFEKGRKSF